MKYFELIKWKIALAVALAAEGGFFLHAGSLAAGRAWAVAAGVFLVSGGACALNQIQERRIDAIMERTRHRPLPSGRMRVSTALTAALTCMAGGILLLALGAGTTPASLSAFAAIWYNGVYTPLKKKTAFAVIPGACVGSVAPLVGWSAAGGAAADPRILSVAFFLALWQMPHFWLLLLMHARDYKRAGLPVLTQLLSERQIAMLTFIWIAAASLAPVGFFVAGLLSPWSLRSVSIAASALLIVRTSSLLKVGAAQKREPRRCFRDLNLFILINGLLLCLAAARRF